MLRTVCGLFFGVFFVAQVHAVSLADFSDSQASDGLRQTLIQSGTEAVLALGKTDGFMGNAKVKIPLPDTLARAEGLMRTLGMGSQADELVLTMNRAAESAVVEAKPLLVNAAKKMTVSDAKGIFSGGEDAATQYFRRTTGSELQQKFRPIVTKVVGRLGLAQRYNTLVDKAGSFGLKEQSVEDYVTEKSLEGLWLMVAEKEKALRHDPVGAASGVARQLLNAVR